MSRIYSFRTRSSICKLLGLSALLFSSVTGYARKNEIKNVFLSTPCSGTNLITNSLQAIVRKPIIWLDGMPCKGSNRLGFELIDSKPFLYRDHTAGKARNMPRKRTRLIVLTRNPKELFFRYPETGSTLADFEKWFSSYTENFRLFALWPEESRKLIFYEDYTEENRYAILLDLISFMGETPTYYDDFVQNEDKYLQRIYKSYVTQHGESHGKSSQGGVPNYTFHSDKQDPDLVRSIDELIAKNYPLLWTEYFQRFESK